MERNKVQVLQKVFIYGTFISVKWHIHDTVLRHRWNKSQRTNSSTNRAEMLEHANMTARHGTARVRCFLIICYQEWAGIACTHLAHRSASPLKNKVHLTLLGLS